MSLFGALFGASETVDLCNRIVYQNNWLAQQLVELEANMSALTDKIDALIAQRDVERANAANADALAQQVATVTAERDALQVDINDALTRLANAGV